MVEEQTPSISTGSAGERRYPTGLIIILSLFVSWIRIEPCVIILFFKDFFGSVTYFFVSINYNLNNSNKRSFN